MKDKPQEPKLHEILPIERVRQTKKDMIESIKINEDDYNYISLNVLPEIDECQCKLIKKYFNFTKQELIDVSNIDVCFGFFVSKYNPFDFRKNLHNLNIMNDTVNKLIYQNGSKIEDMFLMLCDLDDNELFFVLQSFLVRFYSLVTYLTAKQIKIKNINEEYFDSKFMNEEFIYFMNFMVDHGYYDLSIKRLDFISDINRFFKIKNIDVINASKVRGRDDILNIIVSKMFRTIFYKVLFEMNVRNKLEEANLALDTYEIIDELYDYFYRKVFMEMSNEEEGVVVHSESNKNEFYNPDEWE